MFCLYCLFLRSVKKSLSILTLLTFCEKRERVLVIYSSVVLFLRSVKRRSFEYFDLIVFFY